MLLNTSGAVSSPIEYTINIFITIVLGYILEYTYCKYGRSLGNRRALANTFTLLSITTMIVISIVKSSLALSLGLVGALSIVRFRTPIKEPEELTYLFLSIAIGLGMGANQSLMVIIGLTITILLIIYRRKRSSTPITDSLSLIVGSNKENVDKIIGSLKPLCTDLRLKRLTEDKDSSELHLSIKLNSYSQFTEIRNLLINEFPDISINFIDKSVLMN